jgi:hypothetical protein
MLFRFFVDICYNIHSSRNLQLPTLSAAVCHTVSVHMLSYLLRELLSIDNINLLPALLCCGVLFVV